MTLGIGYTVIVFYVICKGVKFRNFLSLFLQIKYQDMKLNKVVLHFTRLLTLG